MRPSNKEGRESQQGLAQVGADVQPMRPSNKEGRESQHPQEALVSTTTTDAPLQ